MKKVLAILTIAALTACGGATTEVTTDSTAVTTDTTAVGGGTLVSDDVTGKEQTPAVEEVK